MSNATSIHSKIITDLEDINFKLFVLKKFKYIEQMTPLDFPLPHKMRAHSFKLRWRFSSTATDLIWERLQKRETFTKGQLPPYQVEFESGETTGRFYPGELNIHHGPLLSAHGVIGEMTETYRDLKYIYGSYAISFRLVRPVRLEFFKKSNAIELKFTVQVAKWFYYPWHLMSEFFWRQFGWSLKLFYFFK